MPEYLSVEVLPVLEYAAMAGVRVDRERAVRDAVVQVFGQHGGDHSIMVAVGDEGRCDNS